MSVDVKTALKALAPKFALKALQTFDRSTTVVVSSCWAAAILMMVFALYAVHLSASAKHDAEAALASEPSLPKIVHRSSQGSDLQSSLDRLQHRYPEVNTTLGNDGSLTITSADGAHFRQWLMALSYVDTIAPQFRWSLRELCVGKCSGSLMSAVLTAEKISFEIPHEESQPPTK